MATAGYPWKQGHLALERQREILEQRREYMLQFVPDDVDTLKHSEKDSVWAQEWSALQQHRDTILHAIIDKENRRGLDSCLVNLMGLLTTIGTYDHKTTPNALKNALCALYWQLKHYFNETEVSSSLQKSLSLAGTPQRGSSRKKKGRKSPRAKQLSRPEIIPSPLKTRENRNILVETPSKGNLVPTDGETSRPTQPEMPAIRRNSAPSQGGSNSKSPSHNSSQGVAQSYLNLVQARSFPEMADSVLVPLQTSSDDATAETASTPAHPDPKELASDSGHVTRESVQMASGNSSDWESTMEEEVFSPDTSGVLSLPPSTETNSTATLNSEIEEDRDTSSATPTGEFAVPSPLCISTPLNVSFSEAGGGDSVPGTPQNAPRIASFGKTPVSTRTPLIRGTPGYSPLTSPGKGAKRKTTCRSTKTGFPPKKKSPFKRTTPEQEIHLSSPEKCEEEEESDSEDEESADNSDEPLNSPAARDVTPADRAVALAVQRKMADFRRVGAYTSPARAASDAHNRESFDISID